MIKPPPVPPAALQGGKIVVGLAWLGSIAALFGGSAEPRFVTLGLIVLGFLTLSHAVELVIFRAYLQSVKATPADYLQSFIFGMFHTGGLKEPDA